MSLILDALNKADRQRDHKAPVPHLGSYHSEPKAHVSGVPAWAIYAVVGLLVLVVLALMLLVFKGVDSVTQPINRQTATTTHLQGSSSQQAAVQQLTSQSSVVHNTHTLSERAGLPAQQSPVEASSEPKTIEQDPVLSQKVASIYERVGDQARQRSQARTADESSAIAQLYTEKPQAQSPREADASDRARLPTAPQQQSTSQKPASELLLAPSQLQAMWDATQQEVPGAASRTAAVDPYRNIPYLHQLPESFKARIPTLAYDNHIFSPKGGAVILNGKTYRAGDDLAPDLVIEAITEKSLVLSYLQKPFRLKALSSWIQMN